MRITVVGGGVAGTAAAWALLRATPAPEVTLLLDRPGASSLYSGALDEADWESSAGRSHLHADVVAFAAAFEAWTVGPAACRVTTDAGVARVARGRDTELLDVGALSGRKIAVGDLGLRVWDARALASSLGASGWARSTGTRFEVASIPGALEGVEADLPCFEIALLLERPGRLERLAERLAAVRGTHEAWLLPPLLGTSPGFTQRLAPVIGKPCGETTSPPGGVAGARFEAARDALLDGLGVRVRRERVERLEGGSSSFRAHLRHPAGSGAWVLESDAVILATGGVAAGGILLAGDRFQASAAGPHVVGLDGRVHVSAASSHGVDLGGAGLGALERVGILVDGVRARGVPRLWVAGDAAEGRPRTALEAARAGILAAREALSPDAFAVSGSA